MKLQNKRQKSKNVTRIRITAAPEAELEAVPAQRPRWRCEVGFERHQGLLHILRRRCSEMAVKNVWSCVCVIVSVLPWLRDAAAHKSARRRCASLHLLTASECPQVWPRSPYRHQTSPTRLQESIKNKQWCRCVLRVWPIVYISRQFKMSFCNKPVFESSQSVHCIITNLHKIFIWQHELQ